MRKRSKKGEAAEARRREARELVLKLDNHTCQDRTCICHVNGAMWLERHHILGKSVHRPDLDHPRFSITFCPIAHSKAEVGFFTGSGENRRFVSGRDYMIGVLEQHENETGFRHAEALAELRKKVRE